MGVTAKISYYPADSYYLGKLNDNLDISQVIKPHHYALPHIFLSRRNISILISFEKAFY